MNLKNYILESQEPENLPGNSRLCNFYMKHISESIIGRRGSNYIRKIPNPTYNDIVRGSIVYIPACVDKEENPYFLQLYSSDLAQLWPDRFLHTDKPWVLVQYSSPGPEYFAHNAPISTNAPINTINTLGFEKHFPKYDGINTNPKIEAVYTPIDEQQISKILLSEKTLIDFLKNLHF